MVSINVPPPQLWGGQHTEMFVNHVTVFSQSVTRIRLSHTIYIYVFPKSQVVDQYRSPKQCIIIIFLFFLQFYPHDVQLENCRQTSFPVLYNN